MISLYHEISLTWTIILNIFVYLFILFFSLDVNQSGEIDQKDFELAIEKICDLRGWPAGHPKNAETYDTMLKIWEGLRAKADKDNDGQVSKTYTKIIMKKYEHYASLIWIS